MSATNRPTSRWSSSTKSSNSTNQTIPIVAPRKKLYRPVVNQQHTFTRMAKTRHDVEQLFKLYYSANIKFDTFQKQVVTGTRIPSAQIPPSLIQDHLQNSSSDIFHSKHCVSREEELNPSDMNEQHIINDESKQTPLKRTVQVRIDNNPSIVHPTSPSPEGIFLSPHHNLITPENSCSSSQHIELNESALLKNHAFIEDIPSDFYEHNFLRKSKSTVGQHPISTLPPIPPSALSLINNKKDLMSLSHSSFSTVNSLQQQQQNQPHIVTGTAVIVRERSPTKSALLKHRTKSCIQQTNLKTSSVSIQYDQPGIPMSLGARVVSIPSKCSRYVLLTFPRVPLRYNAPTYVERLLLPERFPTLFENIMQSRNNKE